MAIVKHEIFRGSEFSVHETVEEAGQHRARKLYDADMVDGKAIENPFMMLVTDGSVTVREPGRAERSRDPGGITALSGTTGVWNFVAQATPTRYVCFVPNDNRARQRQGLVLVQGQSHELSAAAHDRVIGLAKGRLALGSQGTFDAITLFNLPAGKSASLTAESDCVLAIFDRHP